MFLLLGMFVLAFVFTNPLYLLGVLAVVLFFGYAVTVSGQPRAHLVHPGHHRRRERRPVVRLRQGRDPVLPASWSGRRCVYGIGASRFASTPRS